MKKWEYYTHVETSGFLDLPSILTPKGLDGWELISFSQVVNPNGPQAILIFKRELKKGL